MSIFSWEISTKKRVTFFTFHLENTQRKRNREIMEGIGELLLTLVRNHLVEVSDIIHSVMVNKKALLELERDTFWKEMIFKYWNMGKIMERRRIANIPFTDSKSDQMVGTTALEEIWKFLNGFESFFSDNSDMSNLWERHFDNTSREKGLKWRFCFFYLWESAVICRDGCRFSGGCALHRCTEHYFDYMVSLKPDPEMKQFKDAYSKTIGDNDFEILSEAIGYGLDLPIGVHVVAAGVTRFFSARRDYFMTQEQAYKVLDMILNADGRNYSVQERRFIIHLILTFHTVPLLEGVDWVLPWTTIDKMSGCAVDAVVSEDNRITKYKRLKAKQTKKRTEILKTLIERRPKRKIESFEDEPNVKKQKME